MFIALVASLGPDKVGGVHAPNRGTVRRLMPAASLPPVLLIAWTARLYSRSTPPTESHCACCSRTCIKIDSLLAVRFGSTREATWWVLEPSLRSTSGSSGNSHRADLMDTCFSDANLTGAHLVGAYLTHANLQRAILRGAHLMHADLSYAGLRNADLQDADLFGAHLMGTDLSGVRRKTGSPSWWHSGSCASARQPSLELSAWALAPLWRGTRSPLK